jgi:hypothetical protein
MENPHGRNDEVQARGGARGGGEGPMGGVSIPEGSSGVPGGVGAPSSGNGGGSGAVSGEDVPSNFGGRVGGVDNGGGEVRTGVDPQLNHELIKQLMSRIAVLERESLNRNVEVEGWSSLENQEKRRSENLRRNLAALDKRASSIEVGSTAVGRGDMGNSMGKEVSSHAISNTNNKI